MVSWALGHHGEDDGTTGSGMARVDGVVGSRTASGAQHHNVYVVDDVTGLSRGRRQRVKGLNHGWERRRGGSGEESMMAWRL
jgi:hypothetical protein